MPPETDVERALEYSLFGACAERDGRTVAMARVVGDWSFCFYVQDLVVEPNSQGCGIGRAIVHALEKEVATHGAQRAGLLLIASDGSGPFYRHLGYEQLPDQTLGKRFNTDDDV